MKKSAVIKTAFALTFVLAFSVSFCHAQWEKAYSTGYYYHTDPGTFTWSGGSRDGYCDGFGTIQWYDNAGNPTGKYVGYVSYGKNEGYGTQYYTSGDIYYQGNWENDEIKDFAAFKNLGYDVGQFVMDKIFDGGINLRTSVVELINTGDANNELKIRVTFNGDIINTNYYAMTVVVNRQAPYVHFENVNDMAGVYILYRAAELAKEINDYINENKNQ
jgi:hypothetical protein